MPKVPFTVLSAVTNLYCLLDLLLRTPRVVDLLESGSGAAVSKPLLRWIAALEPGWRYSHGLPASSGFQALLTVYVITILVSGHVCSGSMREGGQPVWPQC